MKRVLVTGNLGFIGTNFVNAWKKHDIKLVGLDKASYAANTKGRDISDTWLSDVCDVNDLYAIFKEEDPFDAIVNFAAESHVDNSIVDCSPAFSTNIQGVANLLQVAKEFGVGTFVQVSCYDKKTRALTNNGLKYYDEITEKDMVLSLNAETGKIELKKIKKIIKQNYSGNMVNFLTNRVDMVVTPNHRMFYQKKKNGKLEEAISVSEARDVIKKTYNNCYFPRGVWEGKNDEHVFIEGVGKKQIEDVFYLVGAFLGDGFLATQRKVFRCKSGYSKKEYVKKCRCKKTGQFLNSNEIVKGNKENVVCHSWRVFFDVPEDDKCRGRLEAVLTSLGIKWHAEKNKSGEHIYFSSKEWTKFLTQFGHGCENKRIPQWLLYHNKAALKALFDGLIDSDGSYRKGTKMPQNFTTTSFKLVEGIIEIAFKLGLNPVFEEKSSKKVLYKKENRIIVPRKKSYDVRFRQQNIGLGQDTAYYANYDGVIWCLKVEDNKSFIVERNGKLQFSGNTDEVFGSLPTREGEFTKQSPFKPNSPYAASKASAEMICRSFYKTYGMDIRIVRGCNNFGPWQHEEKLIPKTIKSALDNREIVCYDNGEQMREWIYVESFCQGIVNVLQRGERGKCYHLSSGFELTNYELIKRILEILDKPVSLISFGHSRSAHDFRYFMRRDREDLEMLNISYSDVPFNNLLKKTISHYAKRGEK